MPVIAGWAWILYTWLLYSDGMDLVAGSAADRLR